jgi:acetoin utilization deacetylase AcuC-like enzyme
LVAFICSEDLWAHGHGPQHPLKPERLKRTWEMLQAYHAFDSETSRVVPPRSATDDELCLFHTPDYVAAVRCLSQGEPGVDPGRYNFGPGDNPIFPGMFQSESLKAGAALVGVDTDQVLTISLHEAGTSLFPGTGFMDELGEGAGYGYSVNFPFPPYTDDEPYLEAFRALVPPLVRRFAPDVVVSQLGCDTHWRDPLTHMNLTTHAYEAVVREIKSLAPRWLALGGGGYDLSVVPRAWTLAYGAMLGREFPDELPLAWERPEAIAGYELGRLHDQRMPFIPEDTRRHVRKIVAAQINHLRQVLDLSAS